MRGLLKLAKICRKPTRDCSSSLLERDSGNPTMVTSNVTNCSPAAARNGAENPKRENRMPPKSGPKTMPRPNIAPTRPNARARSFGSTRSATYACVMLMLPPETPSTILATKTQKMLPANASMPHPIVAPT